MWFRPTRVAVSMLSGAFALLSSTGAQAHDSDDRERGLKHRVEALERRVDALEGAHLPLELTVDCAAGETVGAALAAAAARRGPITILVTGVCAEAVTLRRDDVTLRGAAPGAGLRVPFEDATLVRVNGARRVRLEQLTLTGDGTGSGIDADDNGAFTAVGLQVSNLSAGIEVAQSALGEVFDSVIENNLSGVSAGQADLGLFDCTVRNNRASGVSVIGGRLSVSGGAIEANRFSGVSATASSLAILTGVSVTDNSQFGILASFGSLVAVQPGTSISRNALGGLRVQNAAIGSLTGTVVVENNGGGGVTVVDGSFFRMAVGAGPGPRISGNTGNGISLFDTSLAAGTGSLQITGNTGWGVLCAPSPAVAQVTGAFNATTVTGNTTGQISCPGLSIP
jgi:hypothetical protein